MNQAQFDFLKNMEYSLVTLFVGTLIMYISYLKGKQDLRKIQKEQMLKEKQVEDTIENAKLVLELATKNAQSLKGGDSR